MSEKRIGWLDGIRCFAMLWILIVHFIAVFTTNVNVRFPGVLGLLLFGISGKLCVACFCVLLGYFASKPSRHSVPGYALRRYLFFALQVLLIELMYYAAFLLVPDGVYLRVHAPALHAPVSDVLSAILSDAFLLRSQVLPTYWCVVDFVLGSIVIMAAQKLCQNQRWLIRLAACAALLIASLALGRLWVALCVMGWLVRLLLEARTPKHPLFLLALFLLLPWLIRRGECDLTYLLDGVACMIILYIVANTGWLRAFLGLRPFAWLGSYTFELFLLHIPMYYLLRSLMDWANASMLVHVLQFLVVLPLTVAAAAGWRYLAQKTWLPLLDRICQPDASK